MFGFNSKKLPTPPEKSNPLYITLFDHINTQRDDVITLLKQIILSFYNFYQITEVSNKDTMGFKFLEFMNSVNTRKYWTAIQTYVNNNGNIRCKALLIVEQFSKCKITKEIQNVFNGLTWNNALDAVDNIKLITLLQTSTIGIFTNINGSLKDTDGCTTGLIGGKKSIHTRRKKVKQNKRLRRRRTYRKNL